MASFLEAAKRRRAAAASALEQSKASGIEFEDTQVDPVDSQSAAPAKPGPHHFRFEIHGGMAILEASSQFLTSSMHLNLIWNSAVQVMLLTCFLI